MGEPLARRTRPALVRCLQPRVLVTVEGTMEVLMSRGARSNLVVVLLGCCSILASSCESGGATSTSFFGSWDVNTKLVAASQAVNPDYQPGDIRIDVWQFSGTPEACTLTTKDGSVPGVVDGTVGTFDVDVPLDGIIVTKVHIAAFLTGSSSMKGTINADYWDSRFGYKVGMDAWTFEAVKR